MLAVKPAVSLSILPRASPLRARSAGATGLLLEWAAKPADLLLWWVTISIFSLKSVFTAALLEVEVLEDSGAGCKACAGCEACGISFDTTSGFTGETPELDEGG